MNYFVFVAVLLNQQNYVLNSSLVEFMHFVVLTLVVLVNLINLTCLMLAALHNIVQNSAQINKFILNSLIMLTPTLKLHVF